MYNRSVYNNIISSSEKRKGRDVGEIEMERLGCWVGLQMSPQRRPKRNGKRTIGMAYTRRWNMEKRRNFVGFFFGRIRTGREKTASDECGGKKPTQTHGGRQSVQAGTEKREKKKKIG